MGNKIYSKQEYFKIIVNGLVGRAAESWKKFNHIKLSGAFVNRVFIIYKLVNRKPEIMSRIMITDIQVSHLQGIWCEIKDLDTGQVQLIDRFPQFVFGLPVFMYLPLEIEMRWQMWTYKKRTDPALAFSVLTKTLNNPAACRNDNYYIETPNLFIKRHPGIRVDVTDKSVDN